MSAAEAAAKRISHDLGLCTESDHIRLTEAGNTRSNHISLSVVTMSFGFGISDFLAVARIAKSIYESCKAGPAEYKELCSETISLRYDLESLSHDAKEPDSVLNRKGLLRKGELDDIISSCKSTMQDLQTIIDRRSSLQPNREGNVTRIWDAYKVGSSALDSYRGKLTFHNFTISVFLLSLQGPAMRHIETKLNKIYARMIRDDMNQARESTVSLASTVMILSQIDTHQDDVFAILKTELLAEDISMARIIANKTDIISNMKKLLENGADGDAGNEEQPGLLCHQNSVPSPWNHSTTIEGSVTELYEKLETSDRAYQEVKAKLETRELEAEKAYNSKLAEVEADYGSAVTYVKATEVMLKRMRNELTKAKTALEIQEQELRQIRCENTQEEAELSAAIDHAQSTAESEVSRENTMTEARALYETQERAIHEASRGAMEQMNDIYLATVGDIQSAKRCIEELTEAKGHNERLKNERETTDRCLSTHKQAAASSRKHSPSKAPKLVETCKAFRVSGGLAEIDEISRM